MSSYSFKKGLAKGAYSALGALIVLTAFAGFNDVSIWALLETYLKPVIGSMTVAGAITIARNYVKYYMTA
jgi:endonuclease V-like protein UPF0215 family